MTLRITQQVKLGLCFMQWINPLKCVFLSIYLFSPQCNCASRSFPSITASNIWTPRLSTEAQMKTACCSHGGKQIAWIENTSELTYKGWLKPHFPHPQDRGGGLQQMEVDLSRERGRSQLLMLLLTKTALSFS